jgi:predicted aspartyl protease
VRRGAANDNQLSKRLPADCACCSRTRRQRANAARLSLSERSAGESLAARAATSAPSALCAFHVLARGWNLSQSPKIKVFPKSGDRECYTLKSRLIVLGLDMHRHLSLCRLSVALGIVGCAQASLAAAPDNDIRQEFEKYYYGRGVSENQVRAKQYLNEAAQIGFEWAILLIAQEQEKSAPQKAIDAYLRLARNDNCIAQARLANAYATGTLVQENLTQAYFWNLLAKVSEWSRKSNVEYDSARGISYSSGDTKPCGQADHFSADVLEIKIKAHGLLPAELKHAAEDAATRWTKGTAENLLPAPAINAATSEAGPPKVATTTPPLLPVENRKSSSAVEVPLKEDSGIFVVPVEINGAITLDFAVDSGAGNVTIPADVYYTLVRTGTIKDSDIIGQRTVVLADGSQSKLPTFTIRSLKVGDKIIENVNASVLPLEGQLLLGQSFFARFKSWSLDNAKHVLLLNPQ